MFEDVAIFLIYAFFMLIYVSTQAILGSRVYALYGNKRLHLIGLTFLCCILPFIAYVLGWLYFGTFMNSSMLVIYNVLGFSTDLLFMLLIFAHAIRHRSPSTFRFKGFKRGAIFSSTLGIIAESGTDLLSLMVSDSLKYYSITLTMYIITFGTLGLHTVTSDENCIECSLQVTGDSIGDIDALGLVVFMALLTGILAPRLLLNVRKEFYIGTTGEFGQGISAPRGRRTITWRVARRVEHADSYELSSALEGSLGESGADRAPEDDANNACHILEGIPEERGSSC